MFHEKGGAMGHHEYFMLRKKGIKNHVPGRTTVTFRYSEVTNITLFLDLIDQLMNDK